MALEQSFFPSLSVSLSPLVTHLVISTWILTRSGIDGSVDQVMQIDWKLNSSAGEGLSLESLPKIEFVDQHLFHLYPKVPNN